MMAWSQQGQCVENNNKDESTVMVIASLAVIITKPIPRRRITTKFVRTHCLNRFFRLMIPYRNQEYEKNIMLTQLTCRPYHYLLYFTLERDFFFSIGCSSLMCFGKKFEGLLPKCSGNILNAGVRTVHRRYALAILASFRKGRSIFSDSSLRAPPAFRWKVREDDRRSSIGF